MKGEQLLVRMALTYYGNMVIQQVQSRGQEPSNDDTAERMAKHWRTIASFVKTEVRARVLSSRAVHARLPRGEQLMSESTANTVNWTTEFHCCSQ